MNRKIIFRRIGSITSFAVLVGLSTLALHGEEPKWLTDYSEALATARQEKKIVMLDFTGSDWCGWCIKLKNEVFDRPEFVSFANDNLVLVEVDFPRSKALSPEQRTANENLAKEFNVQGFPTIYFVNGDGKKLGYGSYIAGGPKVFIAALTTIPDFDWKKPGDPATNAPAVTNQPAPVPAKFDVPTPATIRSDGLALKGISGPKNKRLALINNQTMTAGETAQIKSDDKVLKIHCKEIQDRSVIIQVEGETHPRELKLEVKAR